MIEAIERERIDSILNTYDSFDNIDKLHLQIFQRIYLRHNEGVESNCLCTIVERRIWFRMFLSWYNENK
jgi:hypothetical protein